MESLKMGHPPVVFVSLRERAGGLGALSARGNRGGWNRGLGQAKEMERAGRLQGNSCRPEAKQGWGAEESGLEPKVRGREHGVSAVRKQTRMVDKPTYMCLRRRQVALDVPYRYGVTGSAWTRQVCPTRDATPKPCLPARLPFCHSLAAPHERLTQRKVGEALMQGTRDKQRLCPRCVSEHGGRAVHPDPADLSRMRSGLESTSGHECLTRQGPDRDPKVQCTNATNPVVESQGVRSF